MSFIIVAIRMSNIFSRFMLGHFVPVPSMAILRHSREIISEGKKQKKNRYVTEMINNNDW